MGKSRPMMTKFMYHSRHEFQQAIASSKLKYQKGTKIKIFTFLHCSFYSTEAALESLTDTEENNTPINYEIALKAFFLNKPSLFPEKFEMPNTVTTSQDLVTKINAFFEVHKPAPCMHLSACATLKTLTQPGVLLLKKCLKVITVNHLTNQNFSMLFHYLLDPYLVPTTICFLHT